MVDVDIHMSHLKEELAWAVDKRHYNYFEIVSTVTFLDKRTGGI